jgi:hypothetical protein
MLGITFRILLTTCCTQIISKKAQLYALINVYGIAAGSYSI